MTRSAPPKLYYRIGEVSELVGVEPHVLRYWEREFRTVRPSKTTKGHRVYSRRDIEQLRRVKDLLYQDGFTIAGAKRRLHQPEPAPTRSQEPALPTQRAPREELRALRDELLGILQELDDSALT